MTIRHKKCLPKLSFCGKRGAYYTLRVAWSLAKFLIPILTSLVDTVNTSSICLSRRIMFSYFWTVKGLILVSWACFKKIISTTLRVKIDDVESPYDRNNDGSLVTRNSNSNRTIYACGDIEATNDRSISAVMCSGDADSCSDMRNVRMYAKYYCPSEISSGDLIDRSLLSDSFSVSGFDLNETLQNFEPTPTPTELAQSKKKILRFEDCPTIIEAVILPVNAEPESKSPSQTAHRLRRLLTITRRRPKMPQSKNVKTRNWKRLLCGCTTEKNE